MSLIKDSIASAAGQPGTETDSVHARAHSVVCPAEARVRAAAAAALRFLRGIVVHQPTFIRVITAPLLPLGPLPYTSVVTTSPYRCAWSDEAKNSSFCFVF